MRNLMWTALAAGCVLAGSSIAMAQDTIRLGGPSAAAAISGGTNIELVRGGHGGGGHGGHGHGGHGHYGHYGHGHYGHYHYGHFGHYGYGRYYAGYYRPYYSAYYWPYYYPSVYVSPSYYYPSYVSSAGYYDYPMVGETLPMPVTMLRGNYQAAPMPPAGGDLTYPYNGGPRLPLPTPAPDAKPPAPRGNLPIDGKLVSLQQPVGGVSLPAAPTTTAKSTTTRVTYPAYGEDPVTSAPRR
jgi:hypothetical protein